MNRIVCHFSCGAASAVATKLALSTYEKSRVVIYNAFIVEEDEDNRRFLSDCEKWFDHPVIVLRDEKYGASVHEVWRRERFIKGQLGASCSMRLKREVIDSACLPDDQHVYGFTWDERNKPRVRRFLDAGGLCPLIERSITHANCLSLIERAGLVLPRRYLEGYNNGNCKGCCKGGMGYWNKTRREDPAIFITVAEIEKAIGPSAYLFYNRETGERFSLYDLPPDAGEHDEEAPECTLFCDEIEREFTKENTE